MSLSTALYSKFYQVAESLGVAINALASSMLAEKANLALIEDLLHATGIRYFHTTTSEFDIDYFGTVEEYIHTSCSV